MEPVTLDFDDLLRSLHPPVDLLDTTAVPPATTAEQVDVWLDRLLHQ